MLEARDHGGSGNCCWRCRCKTWINSETSDAIWLISVLALGIASTTPTIFGNIVKRLC